MDASNMKLYNGFQYRSFIELKGLKSFISAKEERDMLKTGKNMECFDDYVDVINGQFNYNDIFDKYGITHVLVNREEDIKTLSSSVNPVRLKNNPVELNKITILELYSKIIL